MNISKQNVSFGTKIQFHKDYNPANLLKQSFNLKELQEFQAALSEIEHNNNKDTLIIRNEGSSIGFRYINENGERVSLNKMPGDIKAKTDLKSFLIEMYNQFRESTNGKAEEKTEKQQIVDSMSKKYV